MNRLTNSPGDLVVMNVRGFGFFRSIVCRSGILNVNWHDGVTQPSKSSFGMIIAVCFREEIDHDGMSTLHTVAHLIVTTDNDGWDVQIPNYTYDPMFRSV